MRDLLGAVLVDRVIVGRRERVGVAKVDLLLAGPRLALRALDGDARVVHVVSDLAQERLVEGRGEDVVVEDVGDGRRQVLVVLLVRLGVGLLEEVELELGAELRREAELRGPLHLALEHLSRGGVDRLAVVPEDVAEDEGRPFEPRDPAQRGEVRLEDEVAVPALPVGHPVAGDGVHLHVEGEEVVAALDAVLGDPALEEEVSVDALAHQPALHVRERDDDRVDRTGLDLGGQLLERHAGDPNVRAA